MDFADQNVRLTFGDSLTYGHLRKVCYALERGGLCVLPSDTCYSVAALPSRIQVMNNLATLLPDKAFEPIPLAFGSLSMVRKYVKLTGKDIRAIDEFCPGPLTLVCQMLDLHVTKSLGILLHTDNTIGVRIPDSPVERQISSELDMPITTCAIRDDRQHPVQNFDDAVSIMRERCAKTPKQMYLVAINMTRIKYHDHSTVVSVQTRLASPYKIHIYRPGVIDPETIENTMKIEASFRELEDWT